MTSLRFCLSLFTLQFSFNCLSMRIETSNLNLSCSVDPTLPHACFQVRSDVYVLRTERNETTGVQPADFRFVWIGSNWRTMMNVIFLQRRVNLVERRQIIRFNRTTQLRWVTSPAMSTSKRLCHGNPCTELPVRMKSVPTEDGWCPGPIEMTSPVFNATGRTYLLYWIYVQQKAVTLQGFRSAHLC